MVVFKQMIDVLNIIKSQSYYSTTYDSSYDRLIELGFLCLEPERNLITVSKNFIKKYEKRLIKIGFTKYEIKAFQTSPLHPVYFKNEMLAQYLNNPNYHFRWDHYRGSIISIDSGTDDVYLKNICLAHDLNKNEPVTFTFLGDILRLDKHHQNYIQRFEIIEQHYLEPNREVVKNLIHGQWSSYKDSDIYNLLIVGMKICNEIVSKKYSLDLFKEIKENQEYEFFHPIFIASKMNYYLFIMELYKIIYDNISHKAMKKIITMDNPTLKEEIKDNTIWKIMEYSLGKDNFKYLKELSDIRNEPAHDIYNNEINTIYWKKQDEMLIETYKFINTIIVKFSNGILPEKFIAYSDVFGTNGAISYGNGFNQSPYRFYNGQIRLVCEKFKTKDAEYLIAFKSLDNHVKRFAAYIKRKRPDLDKKAIEGIVDKIFNQEAHKPDKNMINSFFKGYSYLQSCYGVKGYSFSNYIEKGEKIAEDFLKKYDINNIFVLGDSTDPYFYDFSDFYKQRVLTGQGYITELIHYFKEDYQYDNVITNPKRNLDIQVISNIWD